MVRDARKAEAHAVVRRRGRRGGRRHRSAAEVADALDGVDVAYYLLHSIGTGGDFARDRAPASPGRSPRRRSAAGVRRIVYLGGMVPEGEELSEHLRSRAGGRRRPARLGRADGGAAGRRRHRLGVGVLRDAALPHRAAAGHGDAEVGAHQDPADRDPGRAALPRRLRRPARRRQPTLRHRRTGRADVLRDDAALRRRSPACRSAACCRCRCCRRGLSSHWVGLGDAGPGGAGPAARRVAAQHGGGGRARHRGARAGPAGGPDRLRPFGRARPHQDPGRSTSRPGGRPPSTAGAPERPAAHRPGLGRRLALRRRRAPARWTHRPEQLWSVIEGIGGQQRLVLVAARLEGSRPARPRSSAAPGLRRGRRNQRELVVGDALDFWRVEESDDHSFLRLRAEMRLPGLAWLELRVGSTDGGLHDVPSPGTVPPEGAARAPVLVVRSTPSTASSSARCRGTSRRLLRRWISDHARLISPIGRTADPPLHLGVQLRQSRGDAAGHEVAEPMVERIADGRIGVGHVDVDAVIAPRPLDDEAGSRRPHVHPDVGEHGLHRARGRLHEDALDAVDRLVEDEGECRTRARSAWRSGRPRSR